MEDEVDIYADLPSFDLGDNENLAEKNKKITEKCTRLEKQVAELTQSLESAQKINTNLEVNISSLLQTAKAEIARKDRMIADIRRQLDNMQFRRGEYAASAKPARRSPRRRKREITPEDKSRIPGVPEVPDVTEFICDNPPPPSTDVEDKSSNKSNQFNGMVNTVFGERLRKRLLEEQEEEERKRKEQSKARGETDSKKIPGSIGPDQIAGSDTQNGLKADSLKSDHKVDDAIRQRNKESNISSTVTVVSDQNASFPKRNYSDRKRQWEDRAELTSSYKKSKGNDGKSRYRDNSRHRDGGGRSSFKNASKSKSEEQTSRDILTSDNLNDYHIIDEYESPAENDNWKKNMNTVDDSENQDRHNRVAIRLMLLAEGIDPDIEAKKSAQNEQKKASEDKREGRKKSRENSKSRSKSKNRRHNHRSRSRTPDEHWKNGRRSRQRGDRYRRSRDRFEKRRDSKNKDGDNLSEFSREIFELKDRIEHRGDDRSSDRNGKGKSLNRHKRNDDKIFKSGRSRTPDSSRSDSKERTVHRSRNDKQYGRSRSRERKKSRNRGKHYANLDDPSIRHTKDVVSEVEKVENAQIMPMETFSEVTQNPETKSLLSLEDGEIVDSVNSSPVKIIDSVQSLTDRTLRSKCKFNLLDSDESASKVANLKCSLPLREIGNSQNNEKLPLVEKPVLSIPESNLSSGLNDSLNSTKDERIENIAEFIANFSTDASESKKDEKLNDKIIHTGIGNTIVPDAVVLEEQAPEEKLRSSSNTVLQDSLKDGPILSPPIENSNVVSLKQLNGNIGDEDWCLIAIDSPIKNFEENRKNRVLALNLQMTEKLEPPKSVTIDEELLKRSNLPSEKLCVKMESGVEKIVSDKTAKPLVQPVKNTSKTKPPTVLRSLKSTYHKGRKEIILSDTNSEQCTKISMPNPMNSATKRLSHESEPVQQNKDDNNRPAVESKKIRTSRSKSPVKRDADHNSKNSQQDDEKQTVVNNLGDKNSVNPAKIEKSSADVQSNATDTKKINLAVVAGRVDEKIKKNGKSKTNNSKTDRGTATKISSIMKPKLGTSLVKEFRGKEPTARKTDSSKTGKADMTKSIGSKNKTGCKVEKAHEDEKSDINKNSENGIKPGKVVSKAKDEMTNNKQKKEPQKLIVFARRRKPVCLEDSLTTSNACMNPILLSDHVDNSERSTNNDTEPLNSCDANNETPNENGDNQSQRTIAKDDSKNDDKF